MKSSKLSTAKVATLKAEAMSLGATDEEVYRMVHLFTVKEVAAYLKASEGFVRARLKEGKLKSINLSERARPKMRIREDDLNDYVNSCLATAA